MPRDINSPLNETKLTHRNRVYTRSAILYGYGQDGLMFLLYNFVRRPLNVYITSTGDNYHSRFGDRFQPISQPLTTPHLRRLSNSVNDIAIVSTSAIS
jgi:hypothetical protein